MSITGEFNFRKAEITDIKELEELIVKSSKEINNAYYSEKEVNAALGTVWVVDQQLIKDQTYWVVENYNEKIVGCGGWSKRKILFGTVEESDEDVLIPGKDSARIRAFFVNPNYVRKGIGKKLLDICEKEAKNLGYTSLELVATLSGEKLYKSKGYLEIKRHGIETETGVFSEGVAMGKQLL